MAPTSTPLREAPAELSHDLPFPGRRLTGQIANAESSPPANYDRLTRIPNRRLFVERLKQAIARGQREAQGFSLLHVDLDHFRRINDTLGHQTGDRILAMVARRIVERVDGMDSLARLGGDEFTIIVERQDQQKLGETVAESLIDGCSHPFEIDNRVLYAAISIGIASYPADGQDIDTLMRHAEIAMYHAKSAGRNRFASFCAAMDNTTPEDLSIEGALRKALDNREFEVYYQPIVSPVDRRCVALEALLRWNSAQHGRIAPDRFIPMLEETGLITTVGRWVLQTACRHFKAMEHHGLGRAILAVNLSGHQFRDANLVDDVQAVLHATGLAPKQLELEITESVLVDDASAAGRTLRALAALGVTLAIDDFGTGYSSLSYLRRFPIKTRKIDRSFVAEMKSSQDAYAIVRSIVSLAHNLGMTVVAEGVESVGQLALLAELGCARLQGFLFSRPLPMSDLQGRFDFAFPAAKYAAQPAVSGCAEPLTRAAADSPITYRTAGKPMQTIFLVDDSTTILLSISSILSKAGYAVEKAANAEDALKKFKDGVKVNLLITDLNMPGMNGIELIREVRKLPAYKFVPILFLTTESQQSKKQEAKAAGASGWIVKPATADELLSTIKLVIR